MDSIPLDLSYEIFSRLPAKSIFRFRCVSVLWRSILCSADFTELFLTKSSARPSLLFAMNGATNNEFVFYSSPQIQCQSEKSSLAAANCKLKLPKDMLLAFCSHASGLICFRHEPLSKKDEYPAHVICNPSTGQSVFLPKVRTTGSYNSFLGFDPVDKVFKVVLSTTGYSSYSYIHNVLTLGTGEMRWRRIQSSLAFTSLPCSGGICINGVLYYLAGGPGANSYIVCFDVGSEEFNFIQEEFSDGYATELVNYKGKLGVVCRPRNNFCGYWSRNMGVNSCHCMNKMSIWVLEDVVKQDWSEHAYTLPYDNFGWDTCRGLSNLCVVGVTATGDIVLHKNYFGSEPFYVFYFNPERNTVKRVEVQGFENPGAVLVFLDHVDDLTINMKSDRVQQDHLTFDMNYHQLQKDVTRFEKINTFAALSLLEDE